MKNKQDVTVKTTKVSGNVYMLQGRGGNIGALTGMQGILIVDDDFKAVSGKLRDALQDLGSASPKFIFNTHWHSDTQRAMSSSEKIRSSSLTLTCENA